MILLLDTHLLLWAAGQPDRLSQEARDMLADSWNALCFSAASLWEITIKRGLGRSDFRVDPHLLRRGLVENDYTEVPITSEHVMATAHLPPFTRIRLTGCSWPRRKRKARCC